MTRDIYVKNKVGLGTTAGLVKATRCLADISDDPEFDVIRFLECDIQRVMPGFYLFIEADENMEGAKAFVTADTDAIVVAESVYNDACAGYFYARKIIAHEFGHVLLHHGVSAKKHFSYGRYVRDRKFMSLEHSAEMQAETYALMLLVPLSEVDRGALSRSFVASNRISPRMAAYVEKRIASIKRTYVAMEAMNAQDLIDAVVRHWSAQKKVMRRSDINAAATTPHQVRPADRLRLSGTSYPLPQGER